MDYTENPFSSSHSLDTNPFDDPQPQANRIADLERREREVAAREREVTAQAEHIRKHGVIKNFPPFFPLIYHSISDEIPEPSRPTMTRLFQLWLLLLLTLVLNLVACIFILLAGAPDGGRDLGAGIMYLFVIGALSFLTWYRPIYNGYMKEQSLYYYLYFFFCGWHLLFSIYMIIGIPGTGSAGLINTISMFSRGAIVAGVLGAIASAGWVLSTLGLMFYYRQTWAHHTTAGHSLEKAKAELATNGAKAYFSRS